MYHGSRFGPSREPAAVGAVANRRCCDASPMTARKLRSDRIWLATSHVSSSLGNVVVVFATAASLTAEDVGAAALVLAAYLLALSVVRGVVGDPALLTKAAVGVHEIAGAAVLLGICCAPVAFWILWLLLPDQPIPVAAISVALPLLLMQDSLRYIAFANRQPRLAAISDITWLALTAVPSVVFLVGGSEHILAFVGPWIGGGVVASFVLLKRLNGRIALEAGWRSLLRERRLRAAMTIDSLATNGVQQIALLQVAVFASLEATGAIRFLQACFGPVTLIFTTMYVDGVWSVSASNEQPNAAARKVAIRMGVILVGAAAIMFALLQFMPLRAGKAFAGSTFVASRDILFLFALSQFTSGIGAGAMSGLRFLGRTGDATRIRLLWAVLLVVGTAWGTSVAGASGFCIALFAANGFAGAAWWWRLLVVNRRSLAVEHLGSRGGSSSD